MVLLDEEDEIKLSKCILLFSSCDLLSIAMRCGKVLIKVLDVVELIQDDVEEGPRMFVSIGVVEESDRGSNGRIFGTISPEISNIFCYLSL